MSHLTSIDSNLTPPMPGQVLREKVLEEMGLTQAELAKAMGVSRPRISMTLTGRCPISPEFALRLGHVTGTSPQFWLRVRAKFELWEEKQTMAGILTSLPMLQTGYCSSANSSVNVQCKPLTERVPVS